MKRLKASKNKDPLDAIIEQGGKQLDAVEKQKESKLRIIEKEDKLEYLKDKIVKAKIL